MARKNKVKETKKINFEQVLCNLAQVPLQIENRPVTLKFAAITALMSPYADENHISGAEKYGRYALAKRIHAGECEFEPQELEKIKSMIAKQFVSLIVGPAFDILDGEGIKPVEYPLAPDQEHA